MAVESHEETTIERDELKKTTCLQQKNIPAHWLRPRDQETNHRARNTPEEKSHTALCKERLHSSSSPLFLARSPLVLRGHAGSGLLAALTLPWRLGTVLGWMSRRRRQLTSGRVDRCGQPYLLSTPLTGCVPWPFQGAGSVPMWAGPVCSSHSEPTSCIDR
ncbi:hypothetical protein EYF80_052189 [Liparis tanakae]|uniref:Uncharacterized protein n=1 Tax=Liparis tanakae TaxID=230148 RepID=A0A4Z2FB83_9TELE|nr:hypothetical protein EYF80_052189 [Liparis tanakae]